MRDGGQKLILEAARLFNLASRLLLSLQQLFAFTFDAFTLSHVACDALDRHRLTALV